MTDERKQDTDTCDDELIDLRKAFYRSVFGKDLPEDDYRALPKFVKKSYYDGRQEMKAEILKLAPTTNRNAALQKFLKDIEELV